MKCTLHKSERLCSENRIDALFNGGRRGTVEPLRFCFLSSERVQEEKARLEETRADTVRLQDNAPVSVLFSVPKKAHKKAWKRNLIKRRMKESYRCRKHALVAAAEGAGRHIDIALICMPSAEIPDFATIDNAIAKILDKILARS